MSGSPRSPEPFPSVLLAPSDERRPFVLLVSVLRLASETHDDHPHLGIFSQVSLWEIGDERKVVGSVPVGGVLGGALLDVVSVLHCQTTHDPWHRTVFLQFLSSCW